MLNQNQNAHSRETDYTEPLSPPHSPLHSSPITSQTLTSIELDKSPHFRIIQLNCYNKHDTTQELLQLNDVDVLILQEPWTNPSNHKVPSHQMWHDITPYDYIPKDTQTKFRTCIYVARKYPIQTILVLPSGNTFITAVELMTGDTKLPKIRVMSFYNRPRTNEGLPLLKIWLDQYLDRQSPTVVGMDANLHHPQWSPAHRTNTHPAARDLIKMCGTAGFKVLSEKAVPTFYPRNAGSPSTIDLTWGNWAVTKHKIECKTLTQTFGSDHQVLQIQFPRRATYEHPTRNTASLKTLNQATYQTIVENRLSLLSPIFESKEQVTTSINQITDILTESFLAQGKIIKDNKHKQKPWWDEDKLQPIIKTRNRARRWMIRSRLPEAQTCYWEWQRFVKQEMEKLKRRHWRAFLAKADKNLTFKALSYTVPTATGSIAPLYRSDRSIATDKEEQAELLFFGTSVALTECSMQDAQAELPPNWGYIPIVPPFEIESIIATLPTKKAKGPDAVPNELMKLAKSELSTILASMFNYCLKTGFYPPQWKNAITAIIRKQGKENYSEPGAYWPIALLSCISKVFETLLSRRLAHWAETNNVIAEGHTGGRRQHSTEDSFVMLTTWIKHKWRQGFIVSGLFLDVKSAYPSVHTDRLIHTLRNQECPEYLVQLIRSFLSNRTTSVRLEDYLSQQFDIKDGLPQGSPASVILYLLYNTSLLIPNPISLTSQRISIGFIDDVTHLVANQDIDQNITDLEQEGRQSLRWGRTHGAIFDEQKAQLMHFTHKKHTNLAMTLGNQTIEPTTEVRWLGLWLDPKLTFSLHISKMHQQGKATIAQLNRISHCYWGLNSRESRKLVTTVLKPRILFGSIAWLTTRTKSKVQKIFQLLQNVANRLILGAFQSSPTKLLSHDTNTLDFSDLAVRAHHLFIYKRLAAPPSHPTQKLLESSLRTLPKTHQDPIHILIGKTHLLMTTGNELETIEPFPTPPWDTPLGDIKNLGLDKETAAVEVLSQVKEETNRGSMVIFTDGSFIQEVGGGAAIALTDDARHKAFGPMAGITNYEMEIMVLSLALNYYIDAIENNTTPINNTLAIFSDSQSALQIMTNPLTMKTAQYLGRHLQELIQHILPTHTIITHWTPGHRDIDLNEKADKEARTAAESEGE